tara:strand:- start:761 stop:1111 length:351 start_codon:yes stop_codon:yes gene_type:complete
MNDAMRDAIAAIIETHDSNGGYDGCTPEYAADAIIAALPDMIAPLVWEQIDSVTYGTTSFLGDSYTVWAMDGVGYCKFPDVHAGERFAGGSDKAKAAADAHHRAAIMANFGGATNG